MVVFFFFTDAARDNLYQIVYMRPMFVFFYLILKNNLRILLISSIWKSYESFRDIKPDSYIN